MIVKGFWPWVVGIFLATAAGRWDATAQGTFVNFEGKQTRPLCLSPDGSRLFAVNTPACQLSVFDVSQSRQPVLIAEIPVGLEPVSVNARDNDEVWVVNEVSDSVSVVSVSARAVIDTLGVKDEPADVLFAQGRAFVSAARNNRIAVFDLSTRAAITNIPVFGENPRALARSPDGSKVYAAFALSGNRTTLVPPERAPAPPLPSNPDLPNAPQVGLIVDATDPTWTSGPNPVIRFTIPDNDVVEIDATSLAVTRYFPRIGTVNLGLAVQPINGDLFVANTEARNLVRFEPNLRGNFLTNRISRVRVADGTVDHFDLNPGFGYDGFPRLPELTNALAQPTAMVFDPGGHHFYVAAFGTDRIARMDASGHILERIELAPEAAGSAAHPRIKRGPRGLALKPGETLYVLNRIANTLTVIGLPHHVIVREIPVGSHDPTPPVIREGRGYLYDAKLSGNGTVSCASCHIDAEMDLLAWDLGDPSGPMQTNRVRLSPALPALTSVFHPMKGPTTTQTLRGLRRQDPLHWRGDRTNFLFFNGAFDGLLGGSVLAEEDMIAFRDFINTIVFQPNPNQNLDRSFPTNFPTRHGTGNAANGRSIFLNQVYADSLHLTCNTCHTLPNGSTNVIIPAAALRESQDFKVPHLRNVYQKLNLNRSVGAQSIGGFGLVHDGSDPDVFTFLSRPVFERFHTNDPVKRDLDAFLQCFDTGMAPAVGYTRTARPDNLTSADLRRDWDLLESQARPPANIELIIQGVVRGRRRGFLYRPTTASYQPDSTNAPALTRAQLEAEVAGGATLSLMGVPPGTGPRLGLDRNEDGVLDGDAAPPALRIHRTQDQVVITWPTNQTGYVLERTTVLPATRWQPDTSARGLVGGNFSVTNSLTSSNLFFRLREL
ncbi:MAG TPA: hypothetical protein VNO52_02855 [Methylomirabilota bacterium]|nr:hypothetical protein [Methylomirabilota bacterium]